MVNMDLRTMILKNNPGTDAFSQTMQYKLSRKLMSERYKSKLQLEEISNFLGLSESGYANLEFGDTKTPIADYVRYLNKMIDYNLEEKEVVSFHVNLDNQGTGKATFYDSFIYTNANIKNEYKMSTTDYNKVKVAS